MKNSKALSGTLDILEEQAKGEKVVFGDIVEALNHRGFGPLLMAPAMLAILPTGSVPGVPVLSGLFTMLIAAQIVGGRKYPWLPRWIKNFTFKRDTLASAVEKGKPYTKKLDRLFRPRLGFMSARPMQIVIALLCCALAALMVIIGFVPLLPAALSLPILFFAVGMTSKDGVVTLLGFALLFVAYSAIFTLSGGMGGEQLMDIRYPVAIQ